MRAIGIAAVGLLLSASWVTATADDRVGVCHVPGEDARLAEVIRVSPAALAAHQDHGDLVGGGTIHVSAAAAFPGRGTADQPFRRITDAMNLARCVRRAAGELTSAERTITIDVAAGKYPGAFIADVNEPTREALPLVANIPGVVYRGHTVMALDAAGLPTGPVEGTETILRAEPPLITTPLGQDQPLILISNTTDGSAGNGTTVEGFVLRSGNTSVRAGLAVLAIRADGLLLRGNVVDEPLVAGFDTRASDVEVAGNFITRVASCGICILGPADVWVHGNRSSGNTSGGLITGPTMGELPYDQGAQSFFVPPFVVPDVAHLEALIEDNDFTGNTANRNNSFGERHFTAARLAPSRPVTSAHVVSRGNRLWNNPFGVLVDAGFPERALPPFSTRFEGDFSADLFERAPGDGTRNCRAGIFASMTRFATSFPFNAGQLAGNRYLDGAFYDLTIPNVTFWVDHPTKDPGPTPAEEDDEEIWNTLVVNGKTLPPPVVDVPLPTSTLPCVMNP
jgi:hypothetical protein